MPTFLEKNKKKSALAALLLFLRTRKTVTALLLLLALASFVFLSPSNLLLGFPGGARVAAGVAWMAGKLGMDTSKWGLVGDKRDYGDLLAAFRAAKDGGGKAGWDAFMRGGDGGKQGAGGGSLDFVKGSVNDLGAAGGSGANLLKPDSIGGVLNPDDAKNHGEGLGVALTENDLSGGRSGVVKSAFAGGFGGGQLSGGAFANAGFFGGGKGGAGGQSASSGKLSDMVKGGLEGIKVQTAKGVVIQGGAKGRLSAARASTINASTSRGLVGTHMISGQRAFVQLAAQRGRSLISVSPNCTADSGCPGEFAAINTGVVYDGGTINGDRTDLLTSPQLDGLSSPNLPDTGLADGYMADAEKMEADAKKCRELDDLYGPQELAYDQQQQALSDKFESMGCGSGGCSKKKARACMAVGDEMKAVCRLSMGIHCKHIHECPLTANNNCSVSECDGPARTLVKVTEYDGTTEVFGVAGSTNIRITTVDQKEQSIECVDSKKDVAKARTAAQNALDAFRSRGCEALGTSTSSLDKFKYMSTCSGPEKQVVSTCKNYASALCSNARSCAGTECTGATDECVITDLPGIDEFIHK